MPCRDEGRRSDPIYIKNPINEELVIMLCSACRALVRLGYDMDENPRLSEWWEGHQLEDERKAEEKKRKKKDKKKRKKIENLLKKPIVDLTHEELLLILADTLAKQS